ACRHQTISCSVNFYKASMFTQINQSPQRMQCLRLNASHTFHDHQHPIACGGESPEFIRGIRPKTLGIPCGGTPEFPTSHLRSQRYLLRSIERLYPTPKANIKTPFIRSHRDDEGVLPKVQERHKHQSGGPLPFSERDGLPKGQGFGRLPTIQAETFEISWRHIENLFTPPCRFRFSYFVEDLALDRASLLPIGPRPMK